MASLAAQAGVAHEIIVVDDVSTDRTRQIAESFPGVRVMDADPLPRGWTGKSNALASGARQARGAWLLFTDADTVHRPASLTQALEEAKRQGAALLSYSPKQEVHGLWERAVMPVIFAELACTYRPSLVSNRNSPAAAANGQYLLISRGAYDAAGGHAAVAGDLLEDVALARAVKRSGRRIFFRYGGDMVRTRMYRSFAQLRDGWTKNLALLFPSALRLALLRALEFVLIAGCATLAIVQIAGGRLALGIGAAVCSALLFGIFMQRIRKAHFSWDTNLLALLGLPLFSYLLLRSRSAHQKGRVVWKGRNYRVSNISSQFLTQRSCH